MHDLVCVSIFDQMCLIEIPSFELNKMPWRILQKVLFCSGDEADKSKLSIKCHSFVSSWDNFRSRHM